MTYSAGVMRVILSLLLAFVVLFVRDVRAENTVTCTGVLIDFDIDPKADFPMAIIYDSRGDFACLIDRGRAGHDPLRPCGSGEKCRIVATFSRKLAQTFAGTPRTYLIRTLISVDHVPN
jgi:hypothetical protein